MQLFTFYSGYNFLLWFEIFEQPSDFAPFLKFQIATEGLRLDISPGISQHMAKFIRICMNEDPGKRPSFEQVQPILDKMKK